MIFNFVITASATLQLCMKLWVFAIKQFNLLIPLYKLLQIATFVRVDVRKM